jgi:hypothetical protein
MCLDPFKNTYDIMGVKKTLETKMNVVSCLTILIAIDLPTTMIGPCVTII